MAKSAEETLNRKVIELVEALKEAHGSDVEWIRVSSLGDVEYPYQVSKPDEPLPDAGLARR